MKGLITHRTCYIYKVISKSAKGGKVCVSENKLKDKECSDCPYQEAKNVKQL